ncbi:copper-binding transcription factor [Onygenales sp. PD_40]|nr:copper-binding transcription factor [Onygenales sp. PD_40]
MSPRHDPHDERHGAMQPVLGTDLELNDQPLRIDKEDKTEQKHQIQGEGGKRLSNPTRDSIKTLRKSSATACSDTPNPSLNCESCGKLFRRPRDLKKHKARHDRSYECLHLSCKNSKGWPTKSERDRHFNDIHSLTPVLYQCGFPPCDYASTREYNCKEHMERAHGWSHEKKRKHTAKKVSKLSPLTAFFAARDQARKNAPPARRISVKDLLC